jgi:acyl-CoA thioesterase FadM
MYPFLRLALGMARARRQPPLDLVAAHVSQHRCWPWDLDPWVELNNGRTLTIYDLGRLPLALRTGLAATLRAQGWGLTVAGVSVRYRRRVRAFDRITTVSRCLGWDARFLYVEQAMWVRGEAASNILLRMAVTSRDGIVAPAAVLAAMGRPADGPALPDWVQAWIAAEALRPWPPAAAP